MTPSAELVVLLDESGHAVGTSPKADVHHRETPLHLAFSCYLFDEEGRVLVTRRALHKPTWPGVWTNSFCGHPAPGEDLAEAVRRRAAEELGLDLRDVHLVLPTFRYEAVMGNGIRENELCPVFVAVTTDVAVPDPEEVGELEWIDWDRFADEVLAGRRDVSPWCTEQVAELTARQEGRARFTEASPSLLPPAARTTPDVAAFLERVEQRLVDHLRARGDELLDVAGDLQPLVRIVRDLARGGKRLRATFCYWGWRGAGGDDLDAAVDAAAALELFHLAALVHDDLMDHSDTRRGSPTAHEVLATRHRAAGLLGDAADFGAGGALLVGDLCLSWSDELFAATQVVGPRRDAARRVFDLMRTQVIAGQYLDVLEQATPGARAEASRRVLRYKSAKYTVEHPLLIGGALAGGSADLLAAYSAYGVPVGEAFQLRDDVLGVFGDPALTGKPVGDDLREGKKTPLLLAALDQVDAADRARLLAGVGDRRLTDQQVTRLQRVIASSGALDQVEQEITTLTDRGTDALRAGPVPAEAAHGLADLARRIAGRTA